MKENQHIEYKESWRDDYLKWTCGFANAERGALGIGRNDRGFVTGLPNAGRLLVDIPNKVRDILGIMVQVNLQEEAGKEYLEIVVEPYPYPVSYKGEYHYRSASTKQELKGRAEQGYPAPRFNCDSNGLWVEFPFGDIPSDAKNPTTGETAQNTPVKTPVKTPVNILQLLENNPHMTLADVAGAIGKSLSAVERAAARLVKAGSLSYVGPQKGGHWEVRR